MPRTLLHYSVDGASQWGVQFGSAIAPLGVGAIGTGQLLTKHWDRIWAAKPEEATLPRERVRLLAPVTTNQQFICQGVNYRSHIAESGLRIEDSAFLETMMSDDGLAAMKAYIAQPYEKRRAWLERPVAPEYKGH